MTSPGALLAGRYRVTRQIGSGGMGVVHLARDETLDRDVAVKVVHAEPESDTGRRFMREARLGAGLRHPHLVTVYDVIPEDGSVLLVMEYVEGDTLADALRRGPVPTERGLAVLRAVGEALDHAHAQGIVHRDVKPANVLLGAAGAVKLADLGIATAADSTRITRTGGTVGTAAYMAPEQSEPGPATAAADVYALAAVAFEVLTGSRAYPGASAFEVMERLRTGAGPPDPREHDPDLPEAAARAIQRGMATDPADRPSSAGAFVAELITALAPEGEGAAPATADHPASAAAEQPEGEVSAATAEWSPVAAPDRPAPAARMGAAERRRRRLVPLALLAFLVLVGVVIVLSAGGDDDPERSAQTQPSTTTTEETPTRPASSGPTTPVEAVRAFYERAADGDLGGSWRLAGPEMRAAFGNSRETFEGDLGSLRGITFERLEQTQATSTTATVELQTVAEHTDRTDHCTGTVKAVKGENGRWLVEPLGIRCTSQ